MSQRIEDERGLLLEHLVGLELHRRTRDLWPEMHLFHFRTRSGAAVDYVLQVGREIWAIEVKAAHRVDRLDLRELAASAQRADKPVRCILVYLGARKKQFEKTKVSPLSKFLAQLPS